MKNLIKKLSTRNKIMLYTFFIVQIIYIVSFFVFTKTILKLSSIESVIRYSILIFFIVYFIVYFLINLVKIIERKKLFFIITTVVTVLLGGVFFFSDFYINRFYNRILNFKESNYILYKTYLITNSGDTFNKNSKIGIIEHESDIEGFILPKELIKKEKLNNELVFYTDYVEMLNDLKTNNIDAIFIQSNYVNLYGGEKIYEDIFKETRIIFEHSKKLKNKEFNKGDFKNIDEPFSFLLIGVDSAEDGLDEAASFNGDVLMLITFNPRTLKATMFSLPRDIMVPISCRSNSIYKINSSAGGGTKCTIDTIKNLTDIEIDYYVKINFKGVVDIVNSLNGITVDVEKPWQNNIYGGKVCEQDSNRKSGKSLICMNPGVQKLNGEQALAYIRNRHQYINDLDRNTHQQQVLQAIVSETGKIRSLNHFEKILASASKNVSVNMDIKEILSSYNIIKKIVLNKGLSVESMKLEVYSLSTSSVSALGYYDDSLEEIKSAQKINLGLEKPVFIKTFSFYKGEEVQELKPGEGKTSNKSKERLASLIGKTEQETRDYCLKKSLNCQYEFDDEGEEAKVYNQSISEGTFLNEFKKIVFYLKTEDLDEALEETTEEELE